MATTPLSAIPTLARLYQLHQLQPSGAPDPRATSRFNHKISLVRHDITRLEVDAIVNAANESLLGGGGVDGAIHRAAGPGLVEECESLGGCRTGSAKITGAYGKLPCKKVIHAVGPVYRTAKRQGQHGRLLQGCYAASLDLAAQNDCRSIAFSALSTGVYGYPSHEAAETAIQAVKAWLEADDARAEKMERVVFCQFMQKDVDAYHEFAPKYFAPAEAVDKMDANTADEETAEAEDAAVPDLPDVPTGEPKKSDEPESKRQKLDETAEVSIPKQNRAVSA